MKTDPDILKEMKIISEFKSTSLSLKMSYSWPIILIFCIVHCFSFMPVRLLFALICYSNKCQLSLFENWNKLQHFRSLTAIRHFATDSIFSDYKSWNRIWCVPRPINFYLGSMKWKEKNRKERYTYVFVYT